MSQITIQTSVAPETLRQALELILGVVSLENNWSISTAGQSATISNATVTSLDQATLESIALFLESTPEFSSKFFSWDSVTAEFKENLTALRAEALSQIDEEAGRTRAKYLTSVPGQDATYIAKEVDCRAFKAAAYPVDTSSYFWVQAEAEATGLTPTQAADAIIAQADQWKVLGSTIEKIRRGGKIEVEKKIKASTIHTSLVATLAALQSL